VETGQKEVHAALISLVHLNSPKRLGLPSEDPRRHYVEITLSMMTESAEVDDKNTGTSCLQQTASRAVKGCVFG